MLFVMLFIFFTQLPNAFSAIATVGRPEENGKKNSEVAFFKSPSSRFPSGYTNLERLKKSMQASTQASSSYYKWNKLYFNQEELRPVFAAHISRTVLDATQTRYLVIDSHSQSLMLQDEKRGIRKKVSVQDVKTDPYDLGFVLTLKDSFLRRSPTGKSEVLTTIPQATKLTAQIYRNRYAQVRYLDYVGFVDISELLTKFDFASFIFAKGHWHQVKAREFDMIRTDSAEKIHLNDIKGLLTPENRGIIASSSQKIPLWSQVETTREKFSVWNKSQLTGHGLIWWQPIGGSTQEYHTTDELLSREVASVSFHPEKPTKGILSADGVFMTEDGINWKKLPQFDGFNGPVHYFNDSLIFVGSQRSTDGGYSFENYIQLDKLAAAIEHQFGFTPKKLLVKRIESRAPFKVKIEVDAGSRQIKMESPLFAQDWKASKG